MLIVSAVNRCEMKSILVRPIAFSIFFREDLSQDQLLRFLAEDVTFDPYSAMIPGNSAGFVAGLIGRARCWNWSRLVKNARN
ncbi:MAG: hypothetical protein N2C14_33840 [Planctomycetales bacterium]